MNRRSIVWGLALVAVSAVGVVGAHRVALADAAGVAASDGARPGGLLGAHGWVATALESVDLRADQRAQVEQLKADVQTQLSPLKAAHEGVMEAVAASVEAGTIDHATIDPLVASAQATALSHGPVFEAAANRLHAILDAGQREQLIGALRSRLMADHGLHGILGHGRPDHLAAIGAQIGLTDDQLATIRARLEAARGDEPGDGLGEGADGMRGHFAHMKVVADAFVSDTFDAHALGIGEYASKMAQRAPRMLAHLEVALPVLTAPQRTQLAQLLRSRELGG